MVALLYGIVVCIATFLGAFVGLGGGVVIKPVLDVIGAHPLEQISFISSCAVFAMSITSMAKHIRNKTPIKPFIVLLVAAGSVAGEFAAIRCLLRRCRSLEGRSWSRESSLPFWRFFGLCDPLCGDKAPHLPCDESTCNFVCGFPIGHGRLFFGHWRRADQCSVFNALFSFSMKDAAVYSVAVIFFHSVPI